MIKEGKINKICVFQINFGICTSRRPRPTQGFRVVVNVVVAVDGDDDDMHFRSGCVRKTQSFI